MALACKSILAYCNACCLRFIQFKFQSFLGHFYMVEIDCLVMCCPVAILCLL